MPDDKLVSALHNKYYSDIPVEQFTQKIGFQSAQPLPSNQPIEQPIDAFTGPAVKAEKSMLELVVDKIAAVGGGIAEGAAGSYPQAKLQLAGLMKLGEYPLSEEEFYRQQWPSGEWVNKADTYDEAVNTWKKRNIVKSTIAELGDDLIADTRKDMKPSKLEKGSLEYYASAITGSTINMLPMLATSILGRRPDIGLGIMLSQSKGSAYEQARLKDLSPTDSAMYSNLMAVAEVVPSAIPLGVLMKPSGNFAKDMLAAGVTEGAQETFTAALQSGIDKGYLKPDMTFSEALGRMKEGAIIGAASGAGISGATSKASGYMDQRDQQKAFENHFGMEFDKATTEKGAVSLLAPDKAQLQQVSTQEKFEASELWQNLTAEEKVKFGEVLNEVEPVLTPELKTDITEQPIDKAAMPEQETVTIDIPVKESALNAEDSKKWKWISNKWNVPMDAESKASFGVLSVVDATDKEGLAKQVIAKDSNGDVIGTLYAGEHSDGKMVGSVEVRPDYRRKGVATEMYNYMEEVTGKKLKPAKKNSEDAQAFWSDRNKKVTKITETEETLPSQINAYTPPEKEYKGKNKTLIDNFGDSLLIQSVIQRGGLNREDFELTGDLFKKGSNFKNGVVGKPIFAAGKKGMSADEFVEWAGEQGVTFEDMNEARSYVQDLIGKAGADGRILSDEKAAEIEAEFQQEEAQAQQNQEDIADVEAVITKHGKESVHVKKVADNIVGHFANGLTLEAALDIEQVRDEAGTVEFINKLIAINEKEEINEQIKENSGKASDVEGETGFTLKGETEQERQQREKLDAEEEAIFGKEKKAEQVKAESMEKPIQNKDTFTNYNTKDDNGEATEQTFTKGEYAKAVKSDRDKTFFKGGEIQFVSQPKKQVKINDQWYDFDSIVKAEKPEVIKPPTKPISEVIESVNKKGSDLTEADKVPETYTVKSYNDFQQ